MRLPAWADVQSLARIFGPASFTYFCKNLCYLMMQVGLNWPGVLSGHGRSLGSLGLLGI